MYSESYSESVLVIINPSVHFHPALVAQIYVSRNRSIVYALHGA